MMLTQDLEELNKGNVCSDVWPTALKKEVEATRMHDLFEMFGNADKVGNHCKQ
jgi:hypothetical protein